MFNPVILPDIIKFCTSAAFVLLSPLLPADAIHVLPVSVFSAPSQATSSNGSSSDSGWLVLPSSLTVEQQRYLLSIPEHLIDDIMTILITIGHTEPACLNTVTVTHSLQSVLALVIFFLRRPWACQSPHLRAKFGLLLFQVFLPCSERSRGDMCGPCSISDDCSLLT